MLYAFFLQNPIGFHHLIRHHTVFGIPGVVHNPVAHLKYAARIVTAAHRLRQLSAAGFFAEIDMGNIIQIDDRP